MVWEQNKSRHFLAFARAWNWGKIQHFLSGDDIPSSHNLQLPVTRATVLFAVLTLLALAGTNQGTSGLCHFLTTQNIPHITSFFCLSDRAGGAKFWKEHGEATAKLEEFCETLKKEQEYRKKITTVLQDGEAFYDAAFGEVKVIVHVSFFFVC